VHCLGGGLDWLERPDWARDWLGRALNAWDFDAVHLDVEVWNAAGWEDDRVRPRLLEQYLTVLQTVREADLPLEIDVTPRLAGDLAGTRRVLDAALDPADRVTVMAYRDRVEGTDGILDFSRSTRVACFGTRSTSESALRLSRPSRLGVRGRRSPRRAGSRWIARRPSSRIT